MMRLRVMMFGLWASAAVAAGIGWERLPVGQTTYTAEFPKGSGINTGSKGVFDNKVTGGKDYFQFVEVRNRGGDRIAVGYWDRYHRTEDPADYFTESFGAPTFRPPKTGSRWGHKAREAGWRFPHGGSMKIQLLYTVELAPQRLLYIDLNCYEAAFKRYEPYYVRLRDSLQPPAKKRR